MSMGPTWNQGAEPPPPKQSGSKLWLIIGLGVGLCVLVCCGGFFGLSAYLGMQFKDAASFEAPVINQARAEMVSIDIPETVPPRFKIDIPVPFTGQKMFVITYYGEAGSDNMIWLAEAGEFLQQQTQGDPDQIRSQLEAQLTAQAVNGQTGSFKTITASGQREIDVTTNGKPSKITLVEGADPQGKQYVQAHGDFHGKAGQGFLRLQLEADKFPPDEVEKIIKSMK